MTKDVHGILVADVTEVVSIHGQDLVADGQALLLARRAAIDARDEDAQSVLPPASNDQTQLSTFVHVHLHLQRRIRSLDEQRRGHQPFVRDS